MTAEISHLKTIGTSHRPVPKKIYTPSEYGLLAAVMTMETHLGTVQAYNALCDSAQRLRAVIEAGQAKQGAAMFATDPEFIFPLSDEA